MSMFDDKATRDRKRRWAAGLKVGDEVAITSGYGFDGRDIRFKAVTRVTKQNGGTVYVDSDAFDFDGDKRGRSEGYRRTHMEEPTQELRDEVESRELRNEILCGVDRDKLKFLPLSALRLIVTVLEQHPPETKR